jgi:hypothetical protein
MGRNGENVTKKATLKFRVASAPLHLVITMADRKIVHLFSGTMIIERVLSNEKSANHPVGH